MIGLTRGAEERGLDARGHGRGGSEAPGEELGELRDHGLRIGDEIGKRHLEEHPPVAILGEERRCPVFETDRRDLCVEDEVATDIRAFDHLTKNLQKPGPWREDPKSPARDDVRERPRRAASRRLTAS